MRSPDKSDEGNAQQAYMAEVDVFGCALMEEHGAPMFVSASFSVLNGVPCCQLWGSCGVVAKNKGTGAVRQNLTHVSNTTRCW